MKKRDMIPYDYKTYTGYVLARADVDSYNAIQARINTFIEAGMPVPEYLINGSFNLMNGCARQAFYKH